MLIFSAKCNRFGFAISLSIRNTIPYIEIRRRNKDYLSTQWHVRLLIFGFRWNTAVTRPTGSASQSRSPEADCCVFRLDVFPERIRLTTQCTL